MATYDFHQYATSYRVNDAVQIVRGRWVEIQDARRTVQYTFAPHYHAYTDEFIEKLNRDGLEALLDVHFQASLRDVNLLKDLYRPVAGTARMPDDEQLDFSDGGPYSVYNWELFFHAPLAVAVHLSKNQRFESAQRWFHFIFDPTSNDPVSDPANPQQRFWKFLRFREESRADFVDKMLQDLATLENTEANTKLRLSIQSWRDRPFQPHVVARNRFLAYQINVVMKYLDNLIAWGDSLFRQDTIETINEATQLYIMASNLLGAKPQRVPSQGRKTAKTYAQLRGTLDAFGNALVEMENDFPFNALPTTAQPADEGASNALFGIGRTLYFCIPPNDKLLAYWDTVADRLFKIRHCMNIEGTVRQLPLFEPPIDPGLLVKAAAAGLDIGSIVGSLGQPASNVRSSVLIQKSIEICAELKSLGAQLLASIEKQEAEHFSTLRQQQELKMLELAQDVRFLQWKEAEASTESLLRSRATAFERWRHFQLILGKTATDVEVLRTLDVTHDALTEENFDEVYASLVGRYAAEIPITEAYRQENSVGGVMEFAGNAIVSVFGGELGKTLPLNKNEHAELNVFLPTADFFSTVSFGLKVAAPLLGLIPQFDVHGTPLGVGGAAEFGGEQLKGMAEGGSDVAKKISDAFTDSANRASKMAGYYRRAEDYVFQNNLAASELIHLGRQLVGSLIREQILKKEYENHVQQVTHSREIQDFIRDKFTQEEFYAWMRGELSRTYFDCYKFAFDLARRTEQVMKYEIMRPEMDEQNFIKFGYWDGGRQGLLAGEALYLDIKRLEMAYHDHNRREYEMTKHISLHRLDPVALLRLKATGICEVTIPEWLFDLDIPGQYMRRIKTVGISIPCVAGPYTGIHCKCSLLSSSIRISAVQGGDYPRVEGEDDSRFRDFQGAIQSVVTSSGQNDAGLFEMNLRDERYLPFEGAGAISKWRFELPLDIPTFDPATISDVIVHLRYTAREAGALRQDAVTAVQEAQAMQSGQPLMLSVQQDFPEAWHRFVIAPSPAEQRLSLAITPMHLPYWTTSATIGDQLPVLFCTIDPEKKRLLFSPTLEAVRNEATEGWEINIANNSPAFKFLNDHKKRIIYLIAGIVLG